MIWLQHFDHDCKGERIYISVFIVKYIFTYGPVLWFMHVQKWAYNWESTIDYEKNNGACKTLYLFSLILGRLRSDSILAWNIYNGSFPLGNSSLQPSRTLLLTGTSTLPVEPREDRLLRSNDWTLVQAAIRILARGLNGSGVFKY